MKGFIRNKYSSPGNKYKGCRQFLLLLTQKTESLSVLFVEEQDKDKRTKHFDFEVQYTHTAKEERTTQIQKSSLYRLLLRDEAATAGVLAPDFFLGGAPLPNQFDKTSLMSGN